MYSKVCRVPEQMHVLQDHEILKAVFTGSLLSLVKWTVLLWSLFVEEGIPFFLKEHNGAGTMK